jgi:hypothetical protein
MRCCYIAVPRSPHETACATPCPLRTRQKKPDCGLWTGELWPLQEHHRTAESVCASGTDCARRRHANTKPSPLLQTKAEPFQERILAHMKMCCCAILQYGKVSSQAADNSKPITGVHTTSSLSPCARHTHAPSHLLSNLIPPSNNPTCRPQAAAQATPACACTTRHRCCQNTAMPLLQLTPACCCLSCKPPCSSFQQNQQLPLV